MNCDRTPIRSNAAALTGLNLRSGLHSKAFAVDDRYLFVGSFNWDPRSVNINTEMGILIDSPALATQTMGAWMTRYPHTHIT